MFNRGMHFINLNVDSLSPKIKKMRRLHKLLDKYFCNTYQWKKTWCICCKHWSYNRDLGFHKDRSFFISIKVLLLNCCISSYQKLCQKWIVNPNIIKWTPKSSDRICSLHFVDGMPTKVNLLPTMHMGYDTKRQKTRLPFFEHPLPAKKTRVEQGEMEIGIINNEVNQIEWTTKLSSLVVLDDHSYCWQKDTPKCLACADQRNLTELLVNEINELTLENKLLKRQTWCYANSNKSCFTWRRVKTDVKLNFILAYKL